MPHIHELYDFTASAFIIHPTEPKLLLHYHKKLKKWIQPGGHIELDEDPLQALQHELEEEAGLEFENYEILNQPDQPVSSDDSTYNLPIPMNFNVHNNSPTHKHIDLCYLVKSKTAEVNHKEGESQEINWFSLEQIIDLHKKGDVFEGTLSACKWIFKNHM